MKRILIALLMAAVVLSTAACTGNETPDTPDVPDTSDSTPADTDETPAAPAKNEGEFKAGVYTATSSYSTEGMSMVWNFVLTLKEDGTFLLTDAEGTEKGSGTYALTEDYYTLTYSDERVSTFVVQKDGTLKLTSDFPYGIAQVQLQLVGDIVFTYAGEITADTTAPEDTTPDATDSCQVYTLVPGTYMATYEKVSQMAGTVVYNYTATVGADGTFAYSVSFDMGGTPYEGAAASGTYTLNGNTFIFTDSEGNVTEGELIGDNTLVISLKASAMAKDPYEVTFAPASFTLAEGTYTAAYEKTSQMAGTVVYNYTATVGADGTFSYKVSFDMGGTPYEGAAASGTYTLNGNTFIFTDSEGNVTEGKLTADNTLVISLKASSMAKDPYEVTFAAASAEA